MAVVQISRIQIRRGKKNTSTGFPQLASGELGWAIDTQELYIGNGSVSEGAPYVGNTKLLTENDNILELSKTYIYKRNSIITTGPTTVAPVERTLQERLDEVVDVKSFGAVGDGIVDDTAAIQRAIDQLYLNISTKSTIGSRIVLNFGPGTYKISEELKIPPFAHLVGAGIDSTIIQQIGNAAVWRTVDGNSNPPNYTPFNSTVSSVRPRYISVEGFTFKTTTANTVGYLDNTDFTSFKNVKFEGIYSYTAAPGTDQIGVYIRSTGVLETANTLFDFCQWVNTGYGIYSDSNSNNISIRNSYFYQLWDGISIGGGTAGARHTTLTGCYFDLVYRYGLHIKKGIGNTSANNKYINVGNLNQNYVNATYPTIRFDNQNNVSTDDHFERGVFLRDQDQSGTAQFVPSVQGLDLIRDNNGFTKIITETLAAIEFYRFPIFESGIYVIDYIINKGPTNSAIRSGQIRINVDLRNELVSMSDSYDYTGSNTVENIVFSAALADYSNTSDGILDTLILRMFNPVGNGSAISNHSFKMLVQGNA